MASPERPILFDLPTLYHDTFAGQRLFCDPVKSLKQLSALGLELRIQTGIDTANVQFEYAARVLVGQVQSVYIPLRVIPELARFRILHIGDRTKHL